LHLPVPPPPHIGDDTTSLPRLPRASQAPCRSWESPVLEAILPMR
jgi:hypothetical protein